MPVQIQAGPYVAHSPEAVAKMVIWCHHKAIKPIHGIGQSRHWSDQGRDSQKGSPKASAEANGQNTARIKNEIKNLLAALTG